MRRRRRRPNSAGAGQTWKSKRRQGNNDPNFEKLSVRSLVAVQKWNVKVGDNVARDQVLGSFMVRKENDTEETSVNLRSPYDGTILEIFQLPKSISLEDSDALGELKIDVASMSFCSHDILDENLCAVCGRKVEKLTTVDGFEQGEDDKLIINVDGGKRLRVSKNEAESNRERTIKRLFKSSKLSLVLDLDHTLIHATSDPRAADFIRSKGAQDAFPFELEVQKTLTEKVKSLHYVKLRPGLINWLLDMNRMYELHIYTAGTRVYAEAIAKIIDPKGNIFQDRIISRTDVPDIDGARDKSLKRIFPVDDNMVIIIDDRADVWRNDIRNLVTIKPYHFFVGMREENNLSGPEFERSKRKKDDSFLKHVGGLLSWIHKEFYQPSGRKKPSFEEQLNRKGSDIKILLEKLKARILRFACVHISPEFASRYNSLIRKAKRMGAKVSYSIDKNTTHVIAPNPTSAIAAEGKRLRIWALDADWILACEHNWSKEREEQFSLFQLYNNQEKNVKIDSSIEPGKAETGNATVDEFGYPLEEGSNIDEFGYPMPPKQPKPRQENLNQEQGTSATEVLVDEYGYPVEIARMKSSEAKAKTGQDMKQGEKNNAEHPHLKIRKIYTDMKSHQSENLNDGKQTAAAVSTSLTGSKHQEDRESDSDSDSDDELAAAIEEDLNQSKE